jgi:poly(A) polymerase
MAWPQTRAVFAALDGQARFVGGCVRNALLALPVADIDLCTPLVPEQTQQRLQAAGIHTVPTGLAFGTITAVVDAAHIYEITTLRHDVRSDGRHAEVAFTSDWATDAARRDLTMNALYADADGTLHDPTGLGITDARAGLVRFVGDAEQRIREDVLRLLRFFRFFAQYGRTPPDPDGLDACQALAPLLPTLSGERVWQELRKLLMASRASEAWALMFARGITVPLLPAPLGSAAPLAALSAWGEPDPLARLAGLVPADIALTAALADRLRLSRAERTTLSAYLSTTLVPPQADADEAPRRRFQHGALLPSLLRLSALRQQPDLSEAEMAEILQQAEGSPPNFPIAGRDLLAAGYPPGRTLGAQLQRLQAHWLAGGCRADKATLLALITPNAP